MGPEECLISRTFQPVRGDEATIDTFLQVNILRKLEDQGDRYVFALFIFQEFFGALFYKCSPFPPKNYILSLTEPSEHPGFDRNVKSQRKL